MHGADRNLASRGWQFRLGQLRIRAQPPLQPAHFLLIVSQLKRHAQAAQVGRQRFCGRDVPRMLQTVGIYRHAVKSPIKRRLFEIPRQQFISQDIATRAARIRLESTAQTNVGHTSIIKPRLDK
jgi:hypothetical protein